MTQDEIIFEPNDGKIFVSQVMVEDRKILYDFIRKFKPKSVLEYGTRYGACTFVILSALLANGERFEFYPFEKEHDARKRTMANIKETMGRKMKVYGAIENNFSKLPDYLDFGFIDHDHYVDTTLFFLETVLPKFKTGSLIGIHDWGPEGTGLQEEAKIIRAISDYLPLEKFRWTYEENEGLSVGWFKKK